MVESSLPVVVGLLDQDYRYRPVTTQIPQDVGWHRSTLPAIEPGTAKNRSSHCLYLIMVDYDSQMVYEYFHYQNFLKFISLKYCIGGLILIEAKIHHYTFIAEDNGQRR